MEITMQPQNPYLAKQAEQLLAPQILLELVGHHLVPLVLEEPQISTLEVVECLVKQIQLKLKVNKVKEVSQWKYQGMRITMCGISLVCN